MKITNIFSNQYNFKSTERVLYARNRTIGQNSRHPVLKNPDVDYHSNYTYFFREDLGKDWDTFVRILNDFFVNSKKVNVYNFACSDGSEAYSFAMKLLSKLGKRKAEKFFPILAFDIDKEILYDAKSNKIPCDVGDKIRIKENVRNYKKYCKVYPVNRDYDSKLFFMPNEKLKNRIEFSEADFVKQIDELEFSNSIIMCRNFWYYLGKNRINQILSKLNKKIDNTSLLVIGDFDRRYILDDLKSFGFKELTLNVFKKD